MEPSREIGKWLLITGGMIIIVGALMYFGSRILPIGKLPGDIQIGGERHSFYFPVVSCIIISIILTIILNLILGRR